MGAPSQAMSGLAKLGAPVVLICLAFFAVSASSALAASSLKIREVFPGSTATDPKAEYVELQMTADGQNDIDGQVVRFYGPGGTETSNFTIPTDVANGASQRTVLLATQEAVEHFPGLPTPDFNIGSGANRMDPSGGGVCLTGGSPADCVTWGAIPIFDLFSGFPDPQTSNAAAIADEAVLRRKITAGCSTYLDSADDTNNSANDFAQVSPSPRNNAATPTETRCAPDTALNTFPTNPTNQTSASFTYGAVPTEPGVSFECKLDAASFAICPNAGKSYLGPLSDGSHTFQVKAIGEGGPDPTPKSFTWTVDTIAPNTVIDSGPPEPSGGFSAPFTYHSSEASSSFRCQLDAGAIQTCAGSGKTYFLLADGSHAFRVWAVDNAGNQDPTAAERTFSVQGVLIDVSPPDTSIVSSPANPSPSENASFTYASTEQGSSFQCSLNSSPFSSCSASGVTYSRLRNGSYRFEVRAADQAGNVDSVPATYSWTVAAPLPRVTFTKAPPGKVNLKSGSKAKLLFKFKADKPGSTFRCRIDKKAFGPCSATTKVKARVGRHRFEVYAIDDLGNVGTSTARRLFRVEKKKAGGLF
jgi:hypothetical protein